MLFKIKNNFSNRKMLTIINMLINEGYLINQNQFNIIRLMNFVNKTFNKLKNNLY